MNRIAAVTMVKNEADIIESFARHVLRLADVLYVMDHHSTDKTVPILQQLQGEGLPVFVDNYEPDEYRQAEVMTGLMRKAMAEGADLVLPLDADEFLLSERGLAWLQGFLRRLEPKYVYRVPWVEYELLAPEEEGDKFLLARPYAFNNVSNMGKVLMGREAVQTQHLSLTQGNHFACRPDMAGKYIGVFDQEIGTDVQVAHFPYRSKGQRWSKDLCMWLSNLSLFTQYTYYAHRYRHSFHQFIEQFHEDKSPCTEEWQGNKRECGFTDFSAGCDLRYTDAYVDPVANALLLSEHLAASHGVIRALFRHPSVSVLLWYDGLDALRDSLASVCCQSYAPQQVLLLAGKQGLSAEAVQLARQLREEHGCSWAIETVAGDVFKCLAEVVRGDYVQWVLSGDRLWPDKLRDMTALLETHVHTRFAVSLTNKKDSGCVPAYMAIEYPENVFFGLDAGMLQPILESGAPYATDLTGFLFRRRGMEASSWLCNVFAGERVLYFNLWGECAAEGEMQAFILEPMAEEKEHCWQPEELLLQQMELGYVLQKLRGSRLLPEDKYQLCRGAYLDRARHEGKVWQAVDSGLLSAYQDLCKEL